MKNLFRDFIKNHVIENRAHIPFNYTLSNKITVVSSLPGVIEFKPPHLTGSENAFVISCGIHGNETAPIEIMDDLVREILTEKLEVKSPLLIIFGHIDAMREGKRFIEDNLNRMFNGNYHKFPKGNIERRRAEEIESSIDQFFQKFSSLEKIHYDLHTAIRASKYPRFAVYPHIIDGRKYSMKQLKTFSAMGIEAVLLMHKDSPTLSYHSSSKYGADAFTLELGKVKKFGENNRRDFDQVENVLRSLIAGKDLDLIDKIPKICKVKKELIKNDEDYQFYIPDETANFTYFKKGEVLSSDSLETYVVEEDGEMIAFPNGKVKVGQRSGLVIIEIDESFDEY